MPFLVLETEEYLCTAVCPSAVNMTVVAAPLTVAVQNVTLSVGSGFILENLTTMLADDEIIVISL